MSPAIQVLLAGLLAASIVISAVSQSPQRSDDHQATSAPSADRIWNSLAEGNKRFIAGKQATHDFVSQRNTLAKDQHPRVAVLSCSDSRVPPEVVFDQGLGDLFVVRVAGNGADPTGIGSLEYAVEHLGSVMIVVLGHQSCGAVKAACSGEKMPTPNLEAFVQPIRHSCSVAKQGHTGEGLIDFAVRDHVGQTAQDLLARSPVLKRAHDEGKLSIVEAYYSLESGLVTRLR